MRSNCYLFFAAAIGAGSACSAADAPPRTLPAEEVAGIVVNETVTAAGEAFFRQFAAAWREHDAAERYTVLVYEMRSARQGSRIRIECARRVLFQAPLPAAQAGIKALSEQAAETGYQKAADAELERLLFRDADVGSDEL